MPLMTDYEDTTRYTAPPEDLQNPEDKSNAEHCFDTGLQDYKDGVKYDECPYVSTMNKTFWQLGWIEGEQQNQTTV